MSGGDRHSMRVRVMFFAMSSLLVLHPNLAIAQDSGLGTFIHLSDVHLDPYYQPQFGVASRCRQPTPTPTPTPSVEARYTTLIETTSTTTPGSSSSSPSLLSTPDDIPDPSRYDRYFWDTEAMDIARTLRPNIFGARAMANKRCKSRTTTLADARPCTPLDEEVEVSPVEMAHARHLASKIMEMESTDDVADHLHVKLHHEFGSMDDDASTTTRRSLKLFESVADVIVSHNDRRSIPQPGAPALNDPVVPTFGQYGCDAPLPLFTAALSAMVSTEPNPDFILMTGDWAAHHFPNSNDTLAAIANATALLMQNYPDNVTILPSIGNNDLVDDYTLPVNDTSWFQSLLEIWGPLFDEKQTNDFANGGYYSARPRNGLRIIVLNTVYYSTRHTPPSGEADPRGQFDWLTKELKKAAVENEAVYIAGHIPPTTVLYQNTTLWNDTYAETYFEIIANYGRPIKGQMFGHTHSDEFRVITSPTTGELVSAMLIAGAISPVTIENPTFRVMMYNTSTMGLLDYDEYFADLDESNMNGNVTFQLEYEFQQAYQEANLNSTSMADVYRKLTTDISVYQEWIDRRRANYNPERYYYYCVLHSYDSVDFSNCIKNLPPVPYGGYQIGNEYY
eukprot:TRINITY_DN3961_c0_g5_i1.p1 TRINITY_DN3961_c0_g5~~TRINITY_DN3961_c0_g5_i1.p1  ORF type:complete len:651 (-),score=127.71 TRINITY_DN3961_c0_g5_i1:55-1914(-)